MTRRIPTGIGTGGSFADVVALDEDTGALAAAHEAAVGQSA